MYLESCWLLDGKHYRQNNRLQKSRLLSSPMQRFGCLQRRRGAILDAELGVDLL